MDYVVDINYLRTPADPKVLRRPELGALLQSSPPTDRFIVTDTAMLETMKNAQWETTARASFRIVSQFPQKIWLAKAPGNLIRSELDTGRETTEIIDVPAGAGFHSLMTEENNVRELRHDILQVLNSNIQFAPAAAAPSN